MSFFGVVVHGDGVGKTLGYPTANIDVVGDLSYSDGIYAAFASVDAVKYGAAVVISQFGEKCEAHLFDYAGDLIYGKVITVFIVRVVSVFVPVASNELLKQKIAEDILKIKDVLYEQGN